MKFVKALVAAALLVPSAASAQNNPPVPTNFVFLAPLLTGFIAVPFILGDGDDTVTPVVTPIPTPGPITTGKK